MVASSTLSEITGDVPTSPTLHKLRFALCFPLSPLSLSLPPTPAYLSHSVFFSLPLQPLLSDHTLSLLICECCPPSYFVYLSSCSTLEPSLPVNISLANRPLHSFSLSYLSHTLSCLSCLILAVFLCISRRAIYIYISLSANSAYILSVSGSLSRACSLCASLLWTCVLFSLSLATREHTYPSLVLSRRGPLLLRFCSSSLVISVYFSLHLLSFYQMLPSDSLPSHLSPFCSLSLFLCRASSVVLPSVLFFILSFFSLTCTLFLRHGASLGRP